MTPHHARGAVAIVAALVLMVLGGLAALAINTGHVMSVRNQAQNAVDAAALAGAAELDGTPGKFPTARTFAQQFGELHATDRMQVRLDLNIGNDAAGDIVLGLWDLGEPNKAVAFTPYDGLGSPRAVNAVHVRYGRTPERGNALPVFLSTFLSQQEAGVSAEAVAVGGGPCEGCMVPLVFADCLIVRPDGNLDCGAVLRFSSATVDNIGFSNLQDNVRPVNPPGIVDILNGDCAHAGFNDRIGVGNGNNMTGRVIEALLDHLDRNGPKVIAPVISPGSCPDPQFNRLQPVVGMATFTITDVRGPPEQYDREIDIRLECNEVYVDRGRTGCQNFGTTVFYSQLVR